jgi:Tfp pilus assembly protein PilF
MFYLERAMQTDGEESEADMERLRQIHEDDPAAKGPKSALASLYTFRGQRDKARDIFRADMVEAFNSRLMMTSTMTETDSPRFVTF